MGCSIPRWVSGEVPSLERKTLARAGGKGWTLGMALLSSASLGVFDKLTLCTLSVGLSLSNTRSATLQLPAVTVSSLDANLGTQRGKRSTAAVINCRGFFQLAKTSLTLPYFPLLHAFLDEREPHWQTLVFPLLRKISTILIQKSEKEVQLCLWTCTQGFTTDSVGGSSIWQNTVKLMMLKENQAPHRETMNFFRSEVKLSLPLTN